MDVTDATAAAGDDAEGAADEGAKRIWERTDAGRTCADSVEEVEEEEEEEVWSFCDDRRVEVEKDCVAAVFVVECTRDGAAAF